jgi:Uncharacterised nucleotidyltransferase
MEAQDGHRDPGAGGARPQRTVHAAVGLVHQLADAGVCVRLLGGLAVAARCQAAGREPLARTYSDLDLVVDRPSAPRLEAAVLELGFKSAERFNAHHGHVRQLYQAPDGTKVDVFVEQFKMCHSLDLGSRLHIDEVTLALADLMLTKLQVAEITAKDVGDLAALVLDHTLTGDESGLNVDYMVQITHRDWGWFKTVTDNLSVLDRQAQGLGLPREAQERVSATARQLTAGLVAAPKTVRWKARARIGERMAWREDPEET